MKDLDQLANEKASLLNMAETELGTRTFLKFATQEIRSALEQAYNSDRDGFTTVICECNRELNVKTPTVPKVNEPQQPRGEPWTVDENLNIYQGRSRIGRADTITSAQTMISQHNASIGAPTEDAKRLDWLEANNATLGKIPHPDMGGKEWYVRTATIPSSKMPRKRTVMEAIDAAIRREANAPE